MAVDAFLRRSLADVVDRAGVVRVLRAAITSAHAEQLPALLLDPAWTRTRSAAGEVRLGDHLDTGLREAIHEFVETTPLRGADWRGELVDANLLRELFAPVLQQTLVSFAQGLVGSLGALGGVASVAGGLAGGLAGALSGRKSKGGGFAARLESAAKDTAAEFARGALDELRASAATRMQSDEGRALVRRLWEHALSQVHGASLAEVMDDLEAHRRPDGQALALRVGVALFHSEFGQATLERELRALVDTFGARRVGEVLREAEVVAEVRAWLRTQVEHTIAEALEDEGEELAAILDALFVG